MEAIFACHPARSTEWLDYHPKSCELWRTCPIWCTIRVDTPKRIFSETNLFRSSAAFKHIFSFTYTLILPSQAHIHFVAHSTHALLWWNRRTKMVEGTSESQEMILKNKNEEEKGCRICSSLAHCEIISSTTQWQSTFRTENGLKGLKRIEIPYFRVNSPVE